MKITTFITTLAIGLMIGIFTLPVFAEDQSEASEEFRGERHNKFTDEEKAEFRAKREEFREETKDMSPEERRAYRKERIAEKMKDMTPEERERFQAHRDKRKEMYDKIKDMTPEERKAFKQARISEKTKDMSPEEKEEFMKRMQERKKKHGERHAERRDAEEPSE